MVVPLRYRHGGRELPFFSIAAVVGAPVGITVGGPALESFSPADETTAGALRELARWVPTPVTPRNTAGTHRESVLFSQE